MTELAADIRASQQTVSNQQFNLLAFPLLNSVPLINRLEKPQRESGGTFVRHPKIALSLPVSQQCGALIVVIDNPSLNAPQLEPLSVDRKTPASVPAKRSRDRSCMGLAARTRTPFNPTRTGCQLAPLSVDVNVPCVVVSAKSLAPASPVVPGPEAESPDASVR